MQEFITILEQMPKAEIAPPTNTIAHIFHHEHKENFISDWLAFLLNPEYTGSTQPLSALLNLAGVESYVDLSETSVFREHAFEDRRRIDFLIETPSHIIGIENKIWSGLQNKQLEDYNKQLSDPEIRQERKVELILLYPRGNQSLPVNSAKELHGFRPVAYEDLVEAFKKIRFNIFENLRATVLMEDFIVHMEEYIMQKPGESRPNIEMWNFESKYHEELRKLKDALKESKDQFGKDITSRMRDLVCSREDFEAWKMPAYSTYFQLYKAAWEKAQVHYELLKSDEYAPRELTVVLHTQERKLAGKTEELYQLQKTVGQKTFSINYESRETYEASMNRVFSALAQLVDAYTDTIDREILKAATRE